MADLEIPGGATLSPLLPTDVFPVARPGVAVAYKATVEEVNAFVTGGIFNAKHFGATGDGVTDDTTSVRLAMAAAEVSGGIAYLPRGTYKISTDLEFLNVDNVTLCGDGIGKTIIDSSATVAPPKVNFNPAPATSWGVITVASTLGVYGNGTPINNITLRDFTLKVSTDDTTPAGCKPIFVGCTVNCTIQRVQVIGGTWEAIYHEDNYGGKSKNWRVLDCEVYGHKSTGINNNDPYLDGFDVLMNYVHDGVSTYQSNGVYMVGAKGRILGNTIRDVGGFGVFAKNEGAVTEIQDVIIANNIIHGVGSTASAAAWERSGIQTKTLKGYADGGVLVVNNIISDITESPGITTVALLLYGDVVATGNIIRGCVGTNDVAEAIHIFATGGTGNPTRTRIEHNHIEAVGVNNRFRRGIVIENSADNLVVVRDNYVDELSIDAYLDSGFAYLDLGGHAIMENNVFNGHIIIGTLDCGDPAAYIDKSLSTSDLIFTFTPDDATPSVDGRKKFKTANVNPTTITMFHDGFPGQEIWVWINDALTTIDFTGTNLEGNGGADWSPAAGDTLRAVFDGANWHCAVSDET